MSYLLKKESVLISGGLLPANAKLAINILINKNITTKTSTLLTYGFFILLHQQNYNILRILWRDNKKANVIYLLD
tara:strand:+ start:483 stop:707 length:225 start_codon:yes stop_codon:yes gene_type:complete